MGHVYAIRAAFILQLRQMLGASNFITIFGACPINQVRFRISSIRAI